MPLYGDTKREYQRKWLARRREEFFADKACVVCGSTEGLELDHIDPSKKVTHRIWSWSAERRNEEISKCQVLCAEHHKDKTRGQFTKPLVHGTSNAYRKKGCRCDLCGEWLRQYWRDYRASKDPVVD